ncbi:RND transporter, partial [Pseudomonas sp. MWU12-2534b]
LNRLMDTLNRQSPTIAQAEAQYREAQAQLRQAEASLFPSLSATASRSHGVATAGAGASTAYNLGLSANWAVDLWGAVRRAVEAGEAKQQASQAQLAAIRLSSQAQLATAYLQLTVADAQLANLRQSEQLLANSLQLTRNQYAAGIVGDDAVASAESQW